MTHLFKALVQRLMLYVTIPLLSVAVVLFGYTVVRNYEYNYSNMKKKQEAVLRSVDADIRSIEADAMDAVRSMEFLYFTNTRNKGVAGMNAEKLLSVLQKNLSVYDEAVGVVLYNAELDNTYNWYFTTDYVFLNVKLSQYAQEVIDHRQTSLIPMEYGSEQYLFCFFLSSIPIITMGASLCAMFSTCRKLQQDTISGVSDCYFSDFRCHFRRCSGAWLLPIFLLAGISGPVYLATAALVKALAPMAPEEEQE